MGFKYIAIEQPTDGGLTWQVVKIAYPDGGAAPVTEGGKSLAPQVNAATFTANGLNIPTGQNVLIRTTGFYPVGSGGNSESY